MYIGAFKAEKKSLLQSENIDYANLDTDKIDILIKYNKIERKTHVRTMASSSKK